MSHKTRASVLKSSSACACDSVQIEALREIKATATSNGVHDLRWLSVPEAKKLEPSVHCVAALLSPSTGVVDGQECAADYALHLMLAELSSKDYDM
jgi:L-2-hydroxyglutarate oxidase LhgO